MRRRKACAQLCIGPVWTKASEVLMGHTHYSVISGILTDNKSTNLFLVSVNNWVNSCWVGVRILGIVTNMNSAITTKKQIAQTILHAVNLCISLIGDFLSFRGWYSWPKFERTLERSVRFEPNLRSERVPYVSERETNVRALKRLISL